MSTEKVFALSDTEQGLALLKLDDASRKLRSHVELMVIHHRQSGNIGIDKDDIDEATDRAMSALRAIHQLTWEYAADRGVED